MKIAIISNLYNPFTRGGAEKVAEMQAKALKNSGHDVFVISTKPQGGLEKSEQDNISIYRFKPVNFFYYLNDYKYPAIIRLFWHIWDTFNFFTNTTVKKILIKEKPDLVITHNLKGLSFLIPKLIKSLDINHYHILHDVQLVVPSGLILKNKENDFAVNGFLTKAYSKVCKWLFSSPTKVISPSKWLMNFYLEKGFFKFSQKQILPNPVKQINFKQVLKDINSKKSFLFVGQLEKHKGVEWLIDFWQKNNIEYKLTIVGNGSLFTRLVDSNSENIKILGAKYNEELFEQMQKSDFLILPSLCYENSPTVIQMAYQCGLPVIGADIGGAGELIEENKTGFKFESDSEQSFLNCLKKIQQLTLDQYKELRLNCQKKVEEYDIENYIRQLI